MTETFSSYNFDFSRFSDYTVMHSPGLKLSNQGRKCGGVVVFAKKTLSHFITELDTSCDNMIAFRFCSPVINESIFISAYIPPKDSPYYADKDTVCNLTLLEDLILSYQEQFPRAAIVICGDLNARTGEWYIHSEEEKDDNLRFCSPSLIQPLSDSCCCHQFGVRKSKDKTVNSFGKILQNLCRTHHFLLLNGCTPGDRKGSHTYISSQGESVVDYCMLYAHQLWYHFDLVVASRVESDHMPLEIYLGRLKRSKPIQRKHDVLRYTKLQWDNSKVNLFREKIESREFETQLQKAMLLLDQSVDSALTLLSDLVVWSAECMERPIKIGGKSLHKPCAPWYDSECRESKTRAVEALKRFRQFPGECAKLNYLLHRRLYKEVIRKKKKCHFSDMRNSLMNSLGDSRKFWSLIKSVSRRSTPQSDIGLETWKNHFEALLKNNNFNTPPTIEPEGTIHNEILDVPITPAEIRNAFKKLRASKSAGIDNVPGGCLKEAQDKLLPFMTKLFNCLYESHYFPKNWSKSVIVPIHKKGDYHNPDNYRGISLLCASCKLFTSILADRLKTWMEVEDKICSEQAGFRREHSTIDHIFTLKSMILKHVFGEGRGKLYVCFVDYRKAFDSVNHTHLWRVLRESGLSNKFLLMLKAIYRDAQSCVRWHHALSDFFACSVGVKQGAIESPGIFSLYINVVAEFVRQNGKHGVQLKPGMMEIFLLLFADDVVLISTTPTGLQNQINNLVKVSNSLDLKVNIDKTKVMIFRKGGHLAKGEKWFLEGETLDIVNKYKYLGFVFTTRLSTDIALEDLCVKGKQKIIHILKAMWILRCLKTNVFFRMLETQVIPTLLYGSEIWGLERQKKIETVHAFACKKFLGLSTKTPNHLVYGDLGRFPLHIYSYTRVIKYWLKLTKMEDVRLPKQAYLMLKNSNTACRQNWVHSVKDLLHNLGFGYVWINGGVVNTNCFLKQVKQRLKDWFMQEWNSLNRTSERYKWYSIFKTSFGLEEYLNNIDIKKFRDVLIRFRFGINVLAVNSMNKNISDLNCPFCESRDNEKHFLFECKTYSFLRQKYLRQNNFEGDKLRHCKDWMNTNDVRKERALAMYIYYAMKLRTESGSIRDEDSFASLTLQTYNQQQ